MTDHSATLTPADKEADRMDRASRFSKSLWDGTSWLLKFLGASSLLAAGIRIAQADGVQLELSYPGVAAAALVLGAGGAYWVIQVMTVSRRRKGQSARTGRGSAYAILIGLFALQVAGLILAPTFSVVAAYEALKASDESAKLDARLADRLDLYVASVQSMVLVKEFCDKHRSESPASKVLLQSCLSFAETSAVPTQAQAATIAQQLRRSR